MVQRRDKTSAGHGQDLRNSACASASGTSTSKSMRVANVVDPISRTRATPVAGVHVHVIMAFMRSGSISIAIYRDRAIAFDNAIATNKMASVHVAEIVHRSANSAHA